MKYAIYRNEIGLRAIEYADTEELIKPFPYIKKESLPVTINRMGGYTSFDMECEKKNGFIEIIEIDSGQEPLTREQMYPKNSSEFEYGWIDTEGNTYNTGYEGHSVSAEYICSEQNIKTYRPERALEELGWIKVTAHWDAGILRKDVLLDSRNDFFLTKKQADALFDLDLWSVEYVQFYIKQSENRW